MLDKSNSKSDSNGCEVVGWMRKTCLETGSGISRISKTLFNAYSGMKRQPSRSVNLTACFENIQMFGSEEVMKSILTP